MFHSNPPLLLSHTYLQMSTACIIIVIEIRKLYFGFTLRHLPEWVTKSNLQFFQVQQPSPVLSEAEFHAPAPITSELTRITVIPTVLWGGFVEQNPPQPYAHKNFFFFPIDCKNINLSWLWLPKMSVCCKSGRTRQVISMFTLMHRHVFFKHYILYNCNRLHKHLTFVSS